MEQQYNEITNERYRLGYHVMAKSGWINDPNGFVYFKGYYHIFYQHYPYAAEWGPMHWGHARSKDLIHWETLPIALTPGSKEDKDGCFSGTAIVKDDILYLVYTGHHYYEGDDNPDHFWQNQNLAYSLDGVNFTKYKNNPIIGKPPEDNTHHFRDPKVWEHNSKYYQLLGSQANDGLGRAILYVSENLIEWEYLGEIDHAQNKEKEGFMWECPDLFHLNGEDILLCSPQGISPQQTQFLNLHNTGYFLGDLDYKKAKFNRTSNFIELDKGHDFYAAQTLLAPDGRRILIGWMAMWENEMPEQKDGWSGALTLPRELVLKGDQMYMKPIKELNSLRKDKSENKNFQLDEVYSLSNVTEHSEIELDLSLENNGSYFNIYFKDKQNTSFLTLKYSNNNFILTGIDTSDQRYATSNLTEKVEMRIFIDKSSIEIFINEGEVVFTERYYTEGDPIVQIEGSNDIIVHETVYQLENDAVKY
ncbi:MULTISPECIES: glycoside hydrolase family 32 protein [Staphylococcus]|jgi:beta-fructofuranosidase|uniref:glycoside hydrolase family 32 protein n=1 Tax=Staphylococcus TaxID=1279 RepID=UPI00057C131A|nr:MULTISPECIES: glycoside hydrolase family 32 protein [Staphylococcus]MEB7691232.1 glycoside hydrolase family 32 protein [Staphylococcus equorum]